MSTSLERTIDHEGFVAKWEGRLSDPSTEAIDFVDFFWDILVIHDYPNGISQDQGDVIQIGGHNNRLTCLTEVRGNIGVFVCLPGDINGDVIDYPDLTSPHVALQTARDIFSDYMATHKPKQV